jgi:hypothetical protein
VCSFYDATKTHEIEEFTLYSVYTNLSITWTRVALNPFQVIR